jgi:hypothetical protein
LVRGTTLRRRLQVAVLVIAVLGAPALAAASSEGAPGPSAASELHQALHDATTEGWVLETGEVHRNGSLVGLELNQIGTNEGGQISTFGTGVTTLIALDQERKIYIKGNSAGLVDSFSMSKAQAATYANKWLLMTPSNSKYREVAEATTLSSDFGEIRFTGPLIMSPVHAFGGQEVRTITGTLAPGGGLPSRTGTLYVSASGRLLPIGIDEVFGIYTITEAWSKWGRNPHPRIPTTALPFPSS